MGVANSKALELAGIREGVAQPQGGHVEAQNGRLTGLLQETAQQLVYKAFPAATFADFVAGIEAGARLNLSYGITSCTDPAVGLREGFKDWQAYLAARRQGRLPVRMYLMPTRGPPGRPDGLTGMARMTGADDRRWRAG